MTRGAPSLVLLGTASGLSVFGMAIIIPTIPSIAEAFSADYSRVQFVISAYLFGLAIAQPVSGFLCDRFGRRKIMLSGFLLFILACIFCAFAPTLELLIAGRFLQAVGVSVGTVAARAILRDTRTGEEMAQAMSWIAAAMGIAPIIAPLFGGYFDAFFGFRSIFVLTASIGVIVFVGMLLRLDETLSGEHEPPQLKKWLQSYGVLLRSPQFVGYTLIYGFVQGTFFCFLAIGAPFFEAQFAIDPKTFGAIWGGMSITYVIGATLAARATPRLGSDGVMRLSMVLILAGGLLLMLIVFAVPLTPARVLIPLGLIMAVAGAATPGAMAGAVRFHPQIAGTASGLSSAIGLVLGGAFTIVSGSLYTGRFSPVATIMFLSCCAAGFSWMLAARPLRAPQRTAR